MSEDIESTILASSTQLITLNTRITQKACSDLDLIRGWLQTTGQLRAITKQAAVNWAIEYACNALSIPNVSEPSKVVRIRSIPTTAEELKNYYGCK
jgi:hypothetical protein